MRPGRGGLERRMKAPRFANARSMHNAIERARPRQASVSSNKKLAARAG